MGHLNGFLARGLGSLNSVIFQKFNCFRVFQGGVLKLGFDLYISFIYITRPSWFLSFSCTGKLLMAGSKQQELSSWNKYLWINFVRKWNPGIETPGHFTVWWLRLHQARIGVQIPHFMVSVFSGTLSQTDRQTDRQMPRAWSCFRHGQDVGVPTHHVNALGIWVLRRSEVWVFEVFSALELIEGYFPCCLFCLI